jgi:hypothetical protein
MVLSIACILFYIPFTWEYWINGEYDMLLIITIIFLLFVFLQSGLIITILFFQLLFHRPKTLKQFEKDRNSQPLCWFQEPQSGFIYFGYDGYYVEDRIFFNPYRTFWSNYTVSFTYLPDEHIFYLQGSPRWLKLKCPDSWEKDYCQEIAKEIELIATKRRVIIGEKENL